MTAALKLGTHDALLIIDVQIDFCAGGSLAAPDGDAVVPVINRLAPAFANVIITQDWHPPGHQSFASSHPGRDPFETVSAGYGDQTLWPDHCVQDTAGADLHPDLSLADAQMILRKGFRRDVDSYSAFFENDHTTATGLSGYLRTRGVSRVFLTGLVTDFCVRYSALDARKEGFEAVVVDDACRAIDQDGSLDAAWIAMREAGVRRVDSKVFGG